MLGVLIGTDKSSVQQMRLIHKVGFTAQEIESYRQLVFTNLTTGLRSILEAMEAFGIPLTERNVRYIDMVEHAPDLRDGEPFPMEYLAPFKSLWQDENLQAAYERGNEAALPENLK
jgi:guanine nucleotide-binding protein subunit alpha